MTKNPTFIFAKYLWQEYRTLSILGLLALVIGAVVDAASAFLVAPIFDLILQDQGQKDTTSNISQTIFDVFEKLGLPQTTSVVLIIFLGFYLLKSFISVMSGWVEAKIRASITKLMTLNLFKAVINANWKFFLNRNQGDFINSITRETQYVSFAYQAFNNCIVAIFQMVTFSSIALLVSWKLTGICMGVAIIFALPMLYASKLNYKWGKESVKAAAVSNSITQESFSLAKVTQAFSCQEYSYDKLEEQQKIQMNLNVRFYTLVKALQEFYYPLGLVSVITGYYFSRQFSIHFTELSVILYCLWKCVPYMSSFLRNKSQLGQYLPSFENIRHLDKEAAENCRREGGSNFKCLKEKIELKNVSFSYNESDNLALSNIDISIMKGQMTAFVGRSGSGKSTLADVIMGFHEVQEGTVEIDGQNFVNINLNSFRTKIGYVPQQSVLFNTSLKENLLWSRPDASDEEISDALRQANAYEFVMGFPDKLDTVVGDRGIKLSGGQIQRIAIARAVLRKPELLILDEATSALDSESEMFIQDAISKISKETTLIVIAHRLSTIRDADTVYVLENGEVIEKGSYKELSVQDHSFLYNMIIKQKIYEEKVV